MTPTTPHAPAQALNCRACDGLLVPAFPGELLGDIPVTYHQCQVCGTLQLPNPTWLDRAYGQRTFPDPDQGALRRCMFLHRTIRRLRSFGVRILQPKTRVLDFGCGRGYLLRLLLDDGHDAWGLDPYPHPVLGEDRVKTDAPAGAFDLVIASEVIEHTTNPVEVLTELKSKLAPRGLLFLSTEFFDPKKHGPDWHYLAPDHGQHVTFFTNEGMKLAARRAGLHPVLSIRWRRLLFIHLFSNQPQKPALWRVALFRFRQARGEWRARRDGRV